jgi:hypothetical protein
MGPRVVHREVVPTGGRGRGTTDTNRNLALSLALVLRLTLRLALRLGRIAAVAPIPAVIPVPLTLMAVAMTIVLGVVCPGIHRQSEDQREEADSHQDDNLVYSEAHVKSPLPVPQGQIALELSYTDLLYAPKGQIATMTYQSAH